MIETRYYGEGEWARKVVIHHGASESYTISDSDWPKDCDAWGQSKEKQKAAQGSSLMRFHREQQIEDSIR